MTDRLDGYLSAKAQQIDPSALVLSVPAGTDPSPGFHGSNTLWLWILRRHGHPDMRLGTRADSSFGEAQQALSAWIRAQRATKGGA